MMKKILLIFVFLLFSCRQDKHTTINTEVANINQSIDQWHQAAAEADFNTYFSLMTDTAVFVGTDATEVWNKKEFMAFSKPYFDKGKAWTFTKINRNVYFSEKPLAWFDETLNTWMGVCRGSGVMRYENGKWLIQHYVLSLTVPNDKINDVIKIIQAE